VASCHDGWSKPTQRISQEQTMKRVSRSARIVLLVGYVLAAGILAAGAGTALGGPALGVEWSAVGVEWGK
jgi:hypothetical protein